MESYIATFYSQNAVIRDNSSVAAHWSMRSIKMLYLNPTGVNDFQEASLAYIYLYFYHCKSQRIFHMQHLQLPQRLRRIMSNMRLLKSSQKPRYLSLSMCQRYPKYRLLQLRINLYSITETGSCSKACYYYSEDWGRYIL